MIELVALQLPGRGARLADPLISGLLPLSQTIAQVLSPYLDKPFVFFGHSMGGLLCFETARTLRRERLASPVHLFISATGAPHHRKQTEPLSSLPRAALVQKLREFDGAPTEVLQNEELLDLLLPTIRADFELCESYQYQPDAPVNCPITIYGGVEDREVEKERLAAWREVTDGASEIRMFPGGHFYIKSSESGFLSAFAGDLLRVCSQQ